MLIFATAIVILGGVFQVDAQDWIARTNVSYGSDPANIMDIYYPPSGNANISKVIVLIHGGGWSGGKKEDMNTFAIWFAMIQPTGHAIANIEYRLGSSASPGDPKQLDDIEASLNFLRSDFPLGNNLSFSLVGGSAGAHLSMLYSYSRDAVSNKSVKAVVDIVGPTDFTDISYSLNIPFQLIFTFNLVGPCLYLICPQKYNATSPVKYVTADVPPTIGFYGNADPLVPQVQMTLIKNKLTSVGVPNKFTMYPGGHANWAQQYNVDLMTQVQAFYAEHWP